MSATSERALEELKSNAHSHAVKEVSNHRMNSVLIVDEDKELLSSLTENLSDVFGLVEITEDYQSAEELLSRYHFDLVITGIHFIPDNNGHWINRLREDDPLTAVICLSSVSNQLYAVEALKAGASDFFIKPFDTNELLASIDRSLERQRQQREGYVLRRQAKELDHEHGIVGGCEILQETCDIIKRVAPMPSTVLIHGESGTGKELAARAIHNQSGRAGSFVPINCGALQPELLESELFGHVKGAFTGATKDREGLFSYADGGTLFLDEIGELPMAMQTRLLRVMEDRKVRPVGGNKERSVNVRIVAATNRDLQSEIEKGNFREDLYYRLNVLGIRMPALRERISDLPLLVEHFAKAVAADLGIPDPKITQAEIDRLSQYDWPGNIRELKNVIERCLLLNQHPSQGVTSCGAVAHVNETSSGDEDDLTLESVEKRHILRVLSLEGGNKSAAARRLGVSRKTLERKCHQWESEQA